jgi:hypothetical protein
VTAFVQCVGPGGGGGGVLEEDGWNGGGGGGGSGGYSEIYLPAASVLGGVMVTIGQGGTSTAYPGVNPPQAGSTTFGGFCLAYGGWGGISIGQGGTMGQTGEGGAGGQAGIGALTLRGNAGLQGSYANVGTVTPPLGAMYGGRGGVPPMLGGGIGRSAVIFAAGFMDGRDPYTGEPQGPGCGGNGGVSWSATGDIGGGTGGNGMCLVTEYCWADVPAGESCGGTGARVARVGWTPHGEFDGD